MLNVGLRQGSALLFIAVVDMITRKTSTMDILRKLLYLEDLTIVADIRCAYLQERWLEWNERCLARA